VVTNTVAETTIMPAGVGTTNLPANFWTAGKRICIRASAIVKTPSSQSHTYKVKVGASVWTVTAFGYGTADNTPLGLYIQITCLTAGAAGTVAMCLHGQTGVTTSFYSNASRPATMSQALDTTAATWIDVTITPSATTCSFCVQQLALEVLD
jgi:hypothetical protein